MPLRPKAGPGIQSRQSASLEAESKRVVLVVDDDDQVRRLTKLILEREGYVILLAASGPEALSMSRSYPGHIDLLLTDVEMFGISGIGLALQIAAERPGIKILLNSANAAYAQETDFSFLAKPFLPNELRNAVINALENPLVTNHKSGNHPDEDQLEQYARNVLPEAECELIEEHLLVCEPCRKALEEAEDYISAMQAAARRLVTAPAPVEKSPRVLVVPKTARIWAAAAAFVVVLIPVGFYQLNQRSTPVAETVYLQATRGVAGGAKVDSGKRLDLNLDFSGVPAYDSYRLELVNDNGQTIWSKRTPAGKVNLRTGSEKLSAGNYFVRVYAPAGELLREYGLTVSDKP